MKAMNCLGCYKEGVRGYCLNCRKKLFDRKRVSPILPFAATDGAHIKTFHEQVKRLSISGVQLKYSLRLHENVLQLAEKNGQYILKPIPTSPITFPDQAPENEHLTMQIAAQVFKIPTAANALIYYEGMQPAYLTRRFDIKPDGTKYQQEDFAQLSGSTKESNGEHYKYDGSYEDIGKLIRRYVAAYMPNLEIFYSVVLFNYLFSNGDAHMKNFSLIRTETGDYGLTAAYDLMSTVIHTPNEADTALDLFHGDIETPSYKKYGYFGRLHFLEFANRIGIMEIRAERILNEMLSHTDKVEQMIGKSLLSDETKAIYFKNYQEKLQRFEHKD